MKKKLLEVYALAVCFVTLFVLMIVLAMTMYRAVQIIAPTVTMESETYASYQSNDLFWGACGKSRLSEYSTACSELDMKKVRPAEEELTEQREREFALKISLERRDALRSLIQLLIVIFLAGVTFLMHWAIAKKS